MLENGGISHDADSFDMMLLHAMNISACMLSRISVYFFELMRPRRHTLPVSDFKGLQASLSELNSIFNSSQKMIVMLSHIRAKVSESSNFLVPDRGVVCPRNACRCRDVLGFIAKFLTGEEITELGIVNFSPPVSNIPIEDDDYDDEE